MREKQKLEALKHCVYSSCGGGGGGGGVYVEVGGELMLLCRNEKRLTNDTSSKVG